MVDTKNTKFKVDERAKSEMTEIRSHPRSFPSEQLGTDYNQETMTRLSESIHDRLGALTGDLDNLYDKSNTRLGDLEDGLLAGQSADEQAAGSNQAMIPVPQNLRVKKIGTLPIVIAWCDPIEVGKLKSAKGIEFFGSTEENFIPSAECALRTIRGQAGDTDASECRETGTLSVKFGDKYADLKFWDFMNLGTGTTAITNVTQTTSGLITAWDEATANVLTTDIAWTLGDNYEFQCNVPRTLIGQGILPFCVHVIPWDEHRKDNSMYDGHSYFVKARCRGRMGKKNPGGYSDFACATTTNVGGDIGAPTVSAQANLLTNSIHVKWTRGVEWPDYFNEVEEYRVYRSSSADTTILTVGGDLGGADQYLISEGTKARMGLWDRVLDDGTGISPDQTYWYYVQPVNQDGTTWAAGFDSAKLGKSDAPVFISGTEEETAGSGRLKDWLVKWKIPNDAEGTWIKKAKQLRGGGYGIYGLPQWVRFQTDNGEDGGEYIQQHVFHLLVSGSTYKFAAKSSNNALRPEALGSTWTEQEYTITDSAPPDPPT